MAGSTGQRNTPICPIADLVTVSHGKLQARRAMIGNEHVVEDHHSD
jgi:hypothetical protein